MPKPKKQNRPKREASLAQRILGYLRQHPQAEDTLGGIVDWWRSVQESPWARLNAGAAVKELVLTGAIVCRIGRDGKRRFCLAGAAPKSRREEDKKALARAAGKPKRGRPKKVRPAK